MYFSSVSPICTNKITIKSNFSLYILRVIGVKVKKIMCCFFCANSADSVEVPHLVTFHLGLSSLCKLFKGLSTSKVYKILKTLTHAHLILNC